MGRRDGRESQVSSLAEELGGDVGSMRWDSKRGGNQCQVRVTELGLYIAGSERYRKFVTGGLKIIILLWGLSVAFEMN